MKGLTIIGLVLLTINCENVVELVQSSEPEEEDSRATKMTKIRMTVAGNEIIAVLNSSTAAQDFAALLPMTLTLTDYHKTENVSDLPRRLSTVGSPDGFDPSVGDITYYAPWGNLAIFYRDFGYANGLVHLGSIESGLELLNTTEAFEVSIERVD